MACNEIKERVPEPATGIDCFVVLDGRFWCLHSTCARVIRGSIFIHQTNPTAGQPTRRTTLSALFYMSVNVVGQIGNRTVGSLSDVGRLALMTLYGLFLRGLAKA